MENEDDFDNALSMSSAAAATTSLNQIHFSEPSGKVETRTQLDWDPTLIQVVMQQRNENIGSPALDPDPDSQQNIEVNRLAEAAALT